MGVASRSEHAQLCTLQSKMKFTNASVVLLVMVAAAALSLSEGVDKLQIGVKKRPAECTMRTRKGDKLSMHYTVRAMGSWASF